MLNVVNKVRSRPVTTGHTPLAVTKFVHINEQGLLELQNINSQVGLIQMYLCTRFLFLGAIIFMALLGYFMPLAFLPTAFVLCTSLISTLYFDFKDTVEEPFTLLPIIFNAQKQKILVSWCTGKTPRPSFESLENKVSDKNIIIFWLGLILLSLGWIFLNLDWKLSTHEQIAAITSFIVSAPRSHGPF